MCILEERCDFNELMFHYFISSKAESRRIGKCDGVADKRIVVDVVLCDKDGKNYIVNELRHFWIHCDEMKKEKQERERKKNNTRMVVFPWDARYAICRLADVVRNPTTNK